MNIFTTANIPYFVFIVIALFLLIIWVHPKKIRKRKATYPLPFYRLFYTDEKSSKRKEGVIYSKLLHSETYDLQGKPDYVYRHFFFRRFVPVEVKSGSVGKETEPFFGDFLQLITYFLIIEDLWGIRPKEGRLIYQDATFIIPNKAAFRQALLEQVSNMRDMLKTGTGVCEPSFVTCRYCLCRGTVCEFYEQ